MEPSLQTPSSTIEEARATDPVDRLLEDSWETRSRRAGRRELISEAVAAALFLGGSLALAVPALARHGLDPGLAILLVGLYAIVSRAVKFPIGAGYVVPSYLVLVPMLLLLPPGTAPLLAAAGLILGTVGRVVARRARMAEILFSVPDASHALGPALVLTLVGRVHGLELTGAYFLAFLAGGLIDLIASSLRESVALGVAPRLQLRVVALVWAIDACIAPLGLFLAHASRHDHAQLLTVLPLSTVMLLMDRDRNVRIAQAHHRLGLVGRERTRLQAAVGRLGEAFAAKLDLTAVTSILLRGSIDALDADAGQLILDLPGRPSVMQSGGDADHAALVEEATRLARSSRRVQQLARDGVWALALPLGLSAGTEWETGAIAVARMGREFRDDERTLLAGLVERAQTAVCDILAHDALREQAITDPVTRLGNRRKLTNELAERLAEASAGAGDPAVLMLFDLDGFKSYNDTFGHLAGDALLARLGGKLAAAVAPHGSAYRLGGDEFCALVPARADRLHNALAAAAAALRERGETFSIGASCGAVLLPHEATTPDYALQLADQRMYARKRRDRSGEREQTRDVLVQIMKAKEPGLSDHASGVAELAVTVGRRLGMNAEELDVLTRAAELHDIGKVGVPDAILNKPGLLDGDEWDFMRQHTILGERILSAAPALRPVAAIVRASHERWDGCGYPDRVAGEDIPLAARIIAVCDAYDAITSDRCYRKARTAAAAREELLREAGQQFDPTVVDVVLDELARSARSTRPDHELQEDELLDYSHSVADQLLALLEL